MTIQLANCNLFSGDVILESVCTVKTSPDTNVTVKWYYSLEESLAGLNGSIVTPNMETTVNSYCHHEILCSAELKMTNLGVSHMGYYWCEVVEGINGFNSFPSSVLRIAACNTSLSACEKMSRFTTNSINTFGCAVSNNESEAPNLTVVDLQECYPAPLTSQPTTEVTTIEKTTTEVDKPMIATSLSDGKTPLLVTTSVPPTASMSEVSTADTGSYSSHGETMVSTATTPGDDEPEAAFPLALIWPIVGAGVGVMLCVVAILLALILAVQCRRKRGKGRVPFVCVCVCCLRVCICLCGVCICLCGVCAGCGIMSRGCSRKNSDNEV